MSSTIAGASGRKYVQGSVLQRHPKNPELDIYQAAYGNEYFVYKRVSESFYTLSQNLKSEFGGSSRLRMHIDYNQEERILVYKYFKHTSLALITEYPDFPAAQLKKVLRYTGEALKEFHDKGWIHIDVKPDNILVNWHRDKQGDQIVTDVVLGDFDIAFKPEGGEPLQTPYAIGNVMWRSPEGQTARGITKASDVFSFGLVCIYALGAGDLLVLKDYQELVGHGVMPEQEILHRHLLYFGPLPEGLLRQINDESWCEALQKLAEMAELTVDIDPGVRFKYWGEDIAPNLSPGAKSMISRMTNLDPAARPIIDEVLKHEWW
ncbi:hypothetical protein VTL71DRAFT_8843 [Oculimacula yallundae]|uniref:Protein kinase domain-containing protein n=1 Tax=Oculimacula yallundae TaxID=86028 RepID=A0ABR4BT23_9HELO